MKQACLLLAEDRPKDELLIARGLSRPGIPLDITVARDGRQVLDILFPHGEEQAAALRPALVLLDIKMPKMNGLEVLKRIRQHPDTWCVPVVMLSSSDDARDMSEACRLGANSYLRKSVSADRLNGALHALVTYWVGYHEQINATLSD